MFVVIVFSVMSVISVLSYLWIRRFSVALLLSPGIVGVFVFIVSSGPMNKFGPIIPTVAFVLPALGLSLIIGLIMGWLGWAAFSKTERKGSVGAGTQAGGGIFTQSEGVKKKSILTRVIMFLALGYICANIVFFLMNPGSSPWHYHSHEPEPITVVQPGDVVLSVVEISKILDEIDLAYNARKPSADEKKNRVILETTSLILFPARIALSISGFIGYLGPATKEQQAFTISVKRRYNHLVKLGVTKGMARDGHLFAMDSRIHKQNGLSFQKLRYRVENPDLPFFANSSFEEPAFHRGGYGYEVPGWTSVPRADTATFVEHIDGFSAEGRQHLGLDEGASVFQDIEATYKPNKVYILKIAVGNRSGWTTRGNLSTLSLGTRNGETNITKSFDASTIPIGTFSEISLSIDTKDTPELIGKAIRLMLSADGAGRTHFDHVRLNETRN